jgi:hypothetical protein
MRLHLLSLCSLSPLLLLSLCAAGQCGRTPVIRYTVLLRRLRVAGIFLQV